MHDSQELINRIKNKEITVGIIGLGYVGLPLMLTFTDKGYHVVGYDTCTDKIEQLKKGQSYIRHIPARHIQKVIKNGLFTPTTRLTQLTACDVFLLCVPTPLTSNREPNISYVRQAVGDIGIHIKPNALLVLESTTYPGTTEEVIIPMLHTYGKNAGDDYFLAYSPEREDPGNAKFSTRTIPKLVGGYTKECTEVATCLYSQVLNKVHPVSSTRVAEMAKLLENIFRSVNIALVNELKMLCEEMRIDIWEVIDAAATKPFGFMPFYPGPGLGGHCIPVDPFYLTWKAREFDQTTRFIELAGEINTAMHHYVMDRLVYALNEHTKSVKGSLVLIVGVAYKKDVDDIREAPALRLMTMLQRQGAHIIYHDPYVPELTQFDMRSTALKTENLQNVDAALIVTDHSGVDYGVLLESVPVVVDCRNVLKQRYPGQVYRA